MISMKFLAQLPSHTKNGINSILEMPAIKDVISNEKNASETSKTQWT